MDEIEENKRIVEFIKDDKSTCEKCGLAPDLCVCEALESDKRREKIVKNMEKKKEENEKPMVGFNKDTEEEVKDSEGSTKIEEKTTEVKEDEKREEEKKEDTVLTVDKMTENITAFILKELKENIIFMEPKPWIKAIQMMALAGNVEIYGELLVDIENGFPVVKDILIVDQEVTGGSWDRNEEQHAKFLYSLRFKDNDPKYVDGKATGEKRSLEESSEITRRLLGHFHSHNSLHTTGKPSYSGIDTDDVNDWMGERPFWIEVIGTMGGFSGRIAINNPRVVVNAEVKLKWWTGIDATINESEGKVLFRKYTYKYTKPFKYGAWNYYDNDEYYGGMGYNMEPVQSKNGGVQDNKYNKHIVKNEKNNIKKQANGNTTYKKDKAPPKTIIIKWDGKLLIPDVGLPEEYIRHVEKAFNDVLDDDEGIMVEVSEDDYLLYAIYNKTTGIFIEYMLDRLKYRDKETFTLIGNVNDSYGIDEDFNPELTAIEPVMTYKDALDKIKVITYTEALGKVGEDNQLLTRLNEG